MRKLEYLEEGLPIEDRQKLFHCLKRDISETMMRYFLEKETGYPSFHSCGFTDEHIRSIWDNGYFEKVCIVNDIMTKHGRAPLFTDPSDSYRSAKEYFSLFTEGF